MKASIQNSTDISQQQIIMNSVVINGESKKNHINYDEIKKLLMKDPKLK